MLRVACRHVVFRNPSAAVYITAQGFLLLGSSLWGKKQNSDTLPFVHKSVPIKASHLSAAGFLRAQPLFLSAFMRFWPFDNLYKCLLPGATVSFWKSLVYFRVARYISINTSICLISKIELIFMSVIGLNNNNIDIG